MGNYMRMLSGMNVDFHNHSRDIIPNAGQPADIEPANLADRYQPAAKMYFEDTIQTANKTVEAITNSIAELSDSIHLLAEERYEQDLLLMRSCDLMAQLLKAVTEGGTVKPETIEATKHYLEIFGH